MNKRLFALPMAGLFVVPLGSLTLAMHWAEADDAPG
jgi:hypothetical protein